MEARSKPESPACGRPGALCFAAAVALLGACGSERSDEGAAPASPAAAASSLLWHELGSWSGRGDRQTESFEIATGALRLTWTAQQEGDEAAGLQITLHSAISGRPLDVIVDHAGAGADTVRLTAGPRVAYLRIESSGLRWTVALEEGVQSP